jgi:hypothetical protein
VPIKNLVVAVAGSEVTRGENTTKISGGNKKDIGGAGNEKKAAIKKTATMHMRCTTVMRASAGQGCKKIN